MVPTNGLRWIWVDDADKALVYSNPPRHMVLQQWWSSHGDSPEVDPDGGEWRDVEIVEE